MSSGVVQYKLCDNNFDCDNCAFDKALWQKSRSADSSSQENRGIFGRLQRSIEEDEKRSECLFIQNHIILRRLYKNAYFIGFSKFFWMCLEPLEKVTLEITKGFIAAGSPAMHIKRGGLIWDIALPFDCYLLSSMANQFHDSQTANWLGLLEANETDVEGHASSSGNYLHHTKGLLSTLAAETAGHEIGASMYDGGALVESLCELLGERDFASFIKREITLG